MKQLGIMRKLIEHCDNHFVIIAWQEVLVYICIAVNFWLVNDSLLGASVLNWSGIWYDTGTYLGRQSGEKSLLAMDYWRIEATQERWIQVLNNLVHGNPLVMSLIKNRQRKILLRRLKAKQIDSGNVYRIWKFKVLVCVIANAFGLTCLDSVSVLYLYQIFYQPICIRIGIPTILN